MEFLVSSSSGPFFYSSGARSRVKLCVWMCTQRGSEHLEKPAETVSHEDHQLPALHSLIKKQNRCKDVTMAKVLLTIMPRVLKTFEPESGRLPPKMKRSSLALMTAEQ